MALSIGSGEITISAAGGTGSKTYAHGLSFTPTLILWFSNGRAAGGATDGDLHFMFGATQDASNEWCIYGRTNDAITPSVSGSGTSNNASIAFAATATTYDMQADFTSVDGTNFTLNVSDAPAADMTVQFVAFAGVALSVKVGTVTVATGTTEQTFTGVGFTPKLLILSRGGLVTNAANAVAATLGMAMGAVSATNAGWTSSLSDRNGQAASDANTLLGSSIHLRVPTITGTAGGSLTVTSLDSDGFKLTPSVSFGGNTVVGYVALAGANFSAFAGTDAEKTSPGTQAKTGVGFKPQCLLFSSTNGTVIGVSATSIRSSIGVAHGSTNRSAAASAVDNVNPTNTAVSSSAAKCIQTYVASTNAVAAEASLSSFDSDGYTLSWSSSSAARLFGFVALMENAAPVITSNGGGATAAISVAENTTAVTTVTATDAESNTITYSISGGADQAKFSIGSSSGVLTFAVAPDYETPTDSNTDNDYVVIVQASDGSLTDTQTITVTVTNVVTEDDDGANVSNMMRRRRATRRYQLGYYN